jgi:hypothetical protein
VEVDEIYNLACPASPIHYQHDPVQTTKTMIQSNDSRTYRAHRTYSTGSRTSAPRHSLAVSVLLFAVACVFFSAWPVWRAFFPLEIDFNEGWNAYHADAAMGKGELYPDPAGFVGNNYPPLSYYLIGVLSYFTVDAIYVGRALSLLATAAIAAIVALCIRHFNGGRIAAALGGFWFVGTMVRYADWYVGLNDPHLLALSLMCLALLWFLRRDPARAPEPVILLMVMAGFYKHTLIATPITVLAQLARRDSRIALRAAAMGIGVTALGIGLCAAIYGMNFISQLFLAPRHISIGRALQSLERIGAIVPALVIWAAWAWHDRKSEAARFTAVFVGCSFANYLLQKAGYKVDINAQFELNVAVAIGLGLAFDRLAVVPISRRFDPDRIRLAVVGVLGLGLLAAPGIEPYLLAFSAKYRAQFSRSAEVARSEAARIAAIQGNVTCVPVISVCRAAGKPFVYDDAYVGQKIAAVRWTTAQREAKQAKRGLSGEMIDPRASMGPLQRQLPWGRVNR